MASLSCKCLKNIDRCFFMCIRVKNVVYAFWIHKVFSLPLAVVSKDYTRLLFTFCCLDELGTGALLFCSVLLIALTALLSYCTLLNLLKFKATLKCEWHEICL